jgi:RNA polymerase sigma-70 factor (ECF subfamily)
MELDDSTLWAHARAGDADAFTALFRRHAKAIYNYCFRRLGDWSAAEDALSLVFLEAWRRRDTELPSDKVLPWLYGVATNVLRNRRRAERRHRSALARVPRPPAEPDFAPDVDDRLDDERRMRQALAALAALPRREQDVFVLCAWLELSYADAALALGVPLETVRSRLARARGRLGEPDRSGGHEQDETATVREVWRP